MQTLFDRLVSGALYKDLDENEKLGENGADSEVELDKQSERLKKQKEILGNSIKKLKFKIKSIKCEENASCSILILLKCME